MGNLDPANVALRRDLFTRQEVQIEPAMGNLYGLVDGYLRHWNSKGIPLNFAATDDECFLTALQTRPKALRFHAIKNEFGNWFQANPSAASIEMIERAPAEALAKAYVANVQILRDMLNMDNNHAAGLIEIQVRHDLRKFIGRSEDDLAAYRAAYPEEPK